MHCRINSSTHTSSISKIDSLSAFTVGQWIGRIRVRWAHSDRLTPTNGRTRNDKRRSRMEQRRNPTTHRLLLPVTPSASAGAAPSSALDCSAVSAVASSTRRAWSSNQQTCVTTGETQDTADGEASAGSSRPTPSRVRPQRLRVSLSQPVSVQPQHRQPLRALLPPSPALADNRAEPQVGHGQPLLRPAPRLRPAQRRRRTTRPSRSSATVGPRNPKAGRPPRLKPLSQPQQQPPVLRRSAARTKHSCKRRRTRRSRAQRRRLQPQLGLPRRPAAGLPPSHPRRWELGET